MVINTGDQTFRVSRLLAGTTGLFMGSTKKKLLLTTKGVRTWSLGLYFPFWAIHSTWLTPNSLSKDPNKY
jgi:hypothetical protein